MTKNSKIEPKSSRANACPGMTRFRASIHHDLHAVADLHLGPAVEAVEHTEPLDRMVDAGHAVGQRFHGIAGLHGDHLDTQRTRLLDLLERELAERVDGFARVGVALGGLLPGREDEAVDVAVHAHRIDLELPLVAM